MPARGGLSKIAGAMRPSRATFAAIVRTPLRAWFDGIAAIPIAAPALLHPVISRTAMTVSPLSAAGNALPMTRAAPGIRRP